MAAVFCTPDRHGYGVKFSPFLGHRLAVATAQYFGIAGTGTLFVLDLSPTGLVLVRSFNWTEGLYDVTWSERSENLIVTGSSDGSVHLWDTGRQGDQPLVVFKEHTKEVYGVDWSQTRDVHFVLSASWDKTIKLWDVARPTSLTTFTGHEHIVYSAIWSPHVSGCLASASGDGTVRIWDVRKPYMAQLILPAHQGEALNCDWVKYDKNQLFSCGTDNIIKGWDLRNPRLPFKEFAGHQYTVKRVKCSPFSGSIVASSSYDFTVRIWDCTNPAGLIETLEHHTEFVYGLDFNVLVPSQIADCSFDQSVKVYTPSSLAPRRGLV